MYDYKLHNTIALELEKKIPEKSSFYHSFYTRFITNISTIQALYNELYNHEGTGIDHHNFKKLTATIISAFLNRSPALQQKDIDKLEKEYWFLSNDLAGMSLYVDRFCGSIKNLEEKIPYLQELGINLLHHA